MNECAAKMTVDLDISSRLLDIIARKLGHDYLMLMHSYKQRKDNCCDVVFGNYDRFDSPLLRANGKCLSVKFIDAEDTARPNADMYAELTKLLYKTLESGGKLSDGKNEVDASTVPEFMIECVLNGCT